MSDFIKFTIDGPDGKVAAAQIRGNLDRLHSSWMPAVMKAAGEYMRRVVMKRQFDTEGSYLGSGWTALGGSYLAWKEANAYPTVIGKRTGALFLALTGDPEPFSLTGLSYPDNQTTQIVATPVLEWSADHVTIGATVTEDGEDYASSFNAGDGDVPARPIFGEGKFNADVERELDTLMRLPYAAACKTGEFGSPAMHEKVDSEIAQHIAVQALREVVA